MSFFFLETLFLPLLLGCSAETVYKRLLKAALGHQNWCNVSSQSPVCSIFVLNFRLLPRALNRHFFFGTGNGFEILNQFCFLNQ